MAIRTPNRIAAAKVPPQRLEQYRRELFQFLAIPSISAQPKHRRDCLKAARFVQSMLIDRGFEAEILPTGHPRKSNPVVVGSYDPPGSKKTDPALLIYGHYDVQPPDPLKEWRSKPFKPVLRRGKIVARGSSDDKGQSHALICGFGEALQRNDIKFRIKWLIEGEEEMGSEHLPPFLKKHRDRLRAECVLISDSAQFAARRPAILTSLRGISYYELKLTGLDHDLHSGIFGGYFRSPGFGIAHVVNSILDQKTGRILIPGFYDTVKPMTAAQRRMVRSLPFDPAKLLKESGANGFFGETGFSLRERVWYRPVGEVHGFRGGYQDEGAKTVLPAWMSAKFSFRLVADQDPDEVTRLLHRHLKRVVPKGLTYELSAMHGGKPISVDETVPIIAAAREAMGRGFGVEPVFMGEGASIPITVALRDTLGAWPLLVGFGRDDDRIHSPNERFDLRDYYRGIQTASLMPQHLEPYFLSN